MPEILTVLGTGYYLWGGGGGWGKSGGGPGPFFLEKRGGPEDKFTMIGGWIIVCFVKNPHSLQFMWKI